MLLLSTLMSASVLSGAALAQANSCPGFSRQFDLSNANAVNSAFETQAGGSGISYPGSGLQMSISEGMNNIVLQSYDTYTLPLRMDIGMRASPHPGVISTMAAWPGGTTTDAIDLETVGSHTNLILLALFRGGVDDGYGSDVGVHTGDAFAQPGWDWVYQPDGFDSSQDVDYTLVWTHDHISWSANGRLIATYTPQSGAWIESSVPIRLGVWSTSPGEDWAGRVDWASHPQATSVFSHLSLSCPSEDDMRANVAQNNAGNNDSASSQDQAQQADQQDQQQPQQNDVAASNADAQEPLIQQDQPGASSSSSSVAADNDQAEESQSAEMEQPSSAAEMPAAGTASSSSSAMSSSSSSSSSSSAAMSMSSASESAAVVNADNAQVTEDSGATSIAVSLFTIFGAAALALLA